MGNISEKKGRQMELCKARVRLAVMVVLLILSLATPFGYIVPVVMSIKAEANYETVIGGNWCIQRQPDVVVIYPTGILRLQSGFSMGDFVLEEGTIGNVSDTIIHCQWCPCHTFQNMSYYHLNGSAVYCKSTSISGYEFHYATPKGVYMDCYNEYLWPVYYQLISFAPMLLFFPTITIAYYRVFYYLV